MTITKLRLHRSGRALLTHAGPALGDDAKSPQRIGMMNSRRRQPAVNQTVHPLPGQAGFLAPSPQRTIPVASNLKAKRVQRALVRRNAVVTVVSLNDRPQPLTDLRHALVYSFAQFRFDFLQLSAFPLTHRAPQHREHSTSLPTTDLREAQKVECLMLPLSTPLSIVCCKVATLDDARFLGMQFQFELGESLRQFVMKPRGVRLVLKTHDEVISPADDETSPLAFVLRQCCTQRSNT